MCYQAGNEKREKKKKKKREREREREGKKKPSAFSFNILALVVSSLIYERLRATAVRRLTTQGRY